MRRVLVLSACLMSLMIGGETARAGKPADVATFMQLKLKGAQKLLEGIALEDYALIEKNAQDLSLLSREESWQVFQTPEFLRHSEEFRRALETVREAAAKKNVDGAALGYVGMTLTCVNCHKYVRDVRMAQA